MKATRTIHSFATPLGTMLMAADAEGALVALDFPGANVRAQDLDGLERELASAGHAVVRDPAPFRGLLADLERYFAGEPVRFDHPRAPRGTPFQHRVWQALTGIPHGETRTYAQLAASIGRPGAARAVGRANATNPIAVVVPCHRVIGADGALTGYAGGVERKRALLALERSPVVSGT